MSDKNARPGMLPGVPLEVSLALSLHNAPGTYALLVGSGVSRAAEIPTGWEVTLDLVRKLAAASGEEEGTADPEAWYRDAYGQDPNYSAVLEKLARTQQERRDLLQRYFEPSEEDREEGRKLPTQAHRAIAELAAKSCVKVILTTNFDRLMERALEEVGVSPVVISSEDDAAGAPPLQHSGVTVVKVNGDYLDARIRNTPEELASYPLVINRLLRRIFDEYGLVISGWSGTSDTALMEALRGTANRRYTLYWATRGGPSEDIERLVNNLQGVVIESEGADAFFSDILERVEAIESFGSDDPITAKVAVQRVKLYLDDERRHVRLREFVAAEGREARTNLFGENAFPVSWRPATLDTNAQNRELAAEFRRRVLSYDRSNETAVGIMTAGGYYAAEHQAKTFGELLEMTATPPETTGPAIRIWQGLQRYPALRLLYAGGIAAMAAGNWLALKAILRDTMVSDIHGTKPLALEIYPVAVAERRWGNSLFDGTNYYEPVAEWLHRTLREPLDEYLPLGFRYEMAFHGFEVLLALVQVDLLKEEHPENPSMRDRAPLGRFAIMHYERPNDSALSRLRSEYEAANHEWEPIKSEVLLTRQRSLLATVPLHCSGILSPS